MQTKLNNTTNSKFCFLKLNILALLFILVSATSVFATHNRAGEIIFKRISGFTYEITVITYTKISAPADRDSLFVDFGDNTRIVSFPRTLNDQSTLGGKDVRISKYVGRHTYAGPGKFLISVEDPNRNNNILNLKPPTGQSDQVVFYIESQLIINPFSPSNVGPHNNSAVLLNPPIDDACLGQPYKHNPGAFDPDGDSLVYKLVPNRVEGGIIPSYYVSPSDIAPGPDNIITIDAQSGDLLWDAPKQAGLYNIAILIEEYRAGVLVGSVLRDMQITVKTCDNIAPELSLNTKDTCVIAGDFIQLPVSASDPDGDNIVITASGLPFELTNSPATFGQVSGTNNAAFNWNTNCSHVRNSPYQVVVKAEDQDDQVNLVDFKSFLVTVLAPPVENVQVAANASGVMVTWDNYKTTCAKAIALKVYRRDGNTAYEVPKCTSGMPDELDYELIATLSDASVTSYQDNQILPTKELCYRLVACFADGSESVVSEESCTQIQLDIPVMTHVSIGFTNSNSGYDTIRWEAPFSGVDTLGAHPPPYEYKIFEGSGFTTANTAIGTTPASNQFYVTETEFVRTNVNTQDTALVYRVELYSNGNLVSASGTASSVFVTSQSGDGRIKLTWEEDVPWGNYEYTIERFNLITTDYDSIGTSSFKEFEDRNLKNDTTYCYRIKAFGKYASGNFQIPFINYSQQTCAIPIDNVPPCPPVLTGNADCDNEVVTLAWIDSSFSCSPDVASYNLYYKTTNNGDFSVIANLPLGTNNFDFSGENTIAGCFAVTAIDNNGNESEPSNIFCSDNCPTYKLPDVITPNGDGLNDLFKPFSTKFVKSADIKIFNRWGNLVFETMDPEINWNGKFRATNQDVAEGTYFYVISLEVYTLEGINEQQLSGHITLLR